MGNKILDTISDKATEWLERLTAKDFEKAKVIADLNTEKLKQIVINRHLGKKHDLYNSFTTFSIFFKVLSEFTEIAILTKNEEWYNENKTVESVWNLMWNCRQRLDFIKKHYEGNITEYLSERIDSLEKLFLQLVGEGVYSSPVIEMKGLQCNICFENFRRCSHERQYIYNGIICNPIPIAPKILTSDLVQVPKDPRCRLWPWQMEKDMVFETCMKTFLEIDDFMRSSVVNSGE
jgi:hypothetical protein